MRSTRLCGSAFFWLARVVPALAFTVRRPGIKSVDHPNPDIIVNGTFDQILDHNDPSKGNFSQRYWYDAQYWNGPGSPVFLMNAGENAADAYLGYLHNGTLSGLYAQHFGGAVILIEHRYWGESIPADTLNAETLQYLDLPNAIADMTYFAKTVALGFDNSSGGANADESPWVLMGGSYPGALAAWVQRREPGTFWAYHASSAVVETITDFWEYYVPIEEALPGNCSSDVKAVVHYVDGVLGGGSASDVANLKAMFGLAFLDHDDDFAVQIARPLARWQESQQDVFDFCDYIETTSTGSVSSEPVGLDVALPLYAAWVNATAGASCRQYDNCDTYANEESFNTPDVLNADRQWEWLLCHNPFSWWQTGPSSSDGTNIISIFNTVDHWQRTCPLRFPETNGFVSGSVEGFTAEHLDLYTGGWDGDSERVLFVNGEFDPWRSATLSSDFRPGGALNSSDSVPIFVVENGVHCPELVIGEVAEALPLYDGMINIMGGWLSDWAQKS